MKNIEYKLHLGGKMLTPFTNQINNQNRFQQDRAGRLASDEFSNIQKAREDLIDEITAIIQYDEHAHSTSNELARQTWIDIRDEEMVHVGELLALLNYLDYNQKHFVEEGIKEFNERLEKQKNPKQPT